jgi:hypothetical protein
LVLNSGYRFGSSGAAAYLKSRGAAANINYKSQAIAIAARVLIHARLAGNRPNSDFRARALFYGCRCRLLQVAKLTDRPILIGGWVGLSMCTSWCFPRLEALLATCFDGLGVISPGAPPRDRRNHVRPLCVCVGHLDPTTREWLDVNCGQPTTIKGQVKNGTNHLLGMTTKLSFMTANQKRPCGGKLGLLHDHHLHMIRPQNF